MPSRRTLRMATTSKNVDAQREQSSIQAVYLVTNQNLMIAPAMRIVAILITLHVLEVNVVAYKIIIPSMDGVWEILVQNVAMISTAVFFMQFVNQIAVNVIIIITKKMVRA